MADITTTKFKVAITMEVTTAGDIPTDSYTLTNSIKKAVENIGFGNITTFVEVEETGRSTATK